MKNFCSCSRLSNCRLIYFPAFFPPKSFQSERKLYYKFFERVFVHQRLRFCSCAALILLTLYLQPLEWIEKEEALTDILGPTTPLIDLKNLSGHPTILKTRSFLLTFCNIKRNLLIPVFLEYFAMKLSNCTRQLPGTVNSVPTPGSICSTSATSFSTSQCAVL